MTLLSLSTVPAGAAGHADDVVPGPGSGPTRDRLARVLVAAMTDEAGEHAPDLAADIDTLVEHNLAVLDRVWAGRHAYTEADLAPVRAAASRVAAGGVPLEVLLRVLNRAVETLLCRLWGYAGPDGGSAVVPFTRHAMRLARQVTSAATEAFHRESDRLRAADEPGDPRTLRALLAGGPPPHADGVVSVTADHYRIVGASWRPAPVGARVPRHGGPAPLPVRLRTLLPPGSLFQLTASGGTFLLPAPTAPAAGPDPAARLTTGHDRAADVAGLVVALREILGGPVHLASAGPTPVDQLGRVYREEVERTLHLALSLGRPPGHYELSDLAVEAQLDQPGTAREHVRALIAPLLDNPTLMVTLRTLLANDGNRQRTATELRIHRSSLDHRLHRIETLTGMSPTSTVGVQRFGAALTLHALDGTADDPRP